MSTKHSLAPLALAAAVTGLIVGVTFAVNSGGGSSARPAALHLSGSSTVAAAAPSADIPPGSSPYVLDGTLPSGQPADQPVWRPQHPTAADAARIATALGFDGTPTRVEGGWALRHADRLFALRDDGSWSDGLDCDPDRPVSDEQLDIACGVASASAVTGSATGTSGSDDGATPSPAPTPTSGPDDAQARTDAAPILEALGLGDARVTVTVGAPTSTVTASYDVDGQPTSGLTTTLSFDGSDRFAGGSGRLSELTRGDSYPVITAQQAFDLLQRQPRPMMEMCLRRPDNEPGCAPIPPTVITGATLGYALDYDNGDVIVVPAWLFDVKGQDEPLAQVAVAPAYLAPPTPAPSTVPKNEPPIQQAPGVPMSRPIVTPVGASPA